MPDLDDQLRQLRPEIDHGRARAHFDAAVRRRQRRRRVSLIGASCAALLVLAAAVVLVVGDGEGRDGVIAGEPDSGTRHRVAVDGSRLLPPGTTIVPGLDVQPGSSLVASTFPVIDFYPDVTTDQAPIGWQAFLVVDGDPVDVWNSYATTFDLADADARATCVVTALPAPDLTPTSSPNTVQVIDQPLPERFLTEPRLDGENRIDCSLTTPTVAMDMSVGAASCRIDGSAPCPFVLAHLRIAVTDDPAPYDFEQRGTDRLRYDRAIPNETGVPEQIAIPEGSIVHPTFEPDGVSRLPSEGERLDAALDHFLDGTPVAFVPTGGRSLVAPVMLLACNSGLVAVLEIPGAPADVVATFDRATAIDDPLTLSTGEDADGRSWAGGEITTAGGYYIDFVALDTGDGVSTVLITECGD